MNHPFIELVADNHRQKKIKNEEWNKVRGELKVQFEKWGITECEARFPGCLRNNFLGFAHSKKRRKLTKDELYEVALLCQPCHHQLEYGSPENMLSYIKNIIKNRKTDSL